MTDRDAAIDRLLTSRLWEPLPGPQSMAYGSAADVLFYGGAAGGGKTDLMLGLAINRHRRSILFRREFTQLPALDERAQALIGEAGTRLAGKRGWALDDGRTIEFGAVQRPGDERKYQGRAHDLKAFDELTHFTEAQFRFLIAWNRTAHPGQRCRVLAAGNPPVGGEGAWIERYWAPWLDRQHPNPARSGELRWFATLDGKEVERPDGTPFVHDGETIRPRSRSFVAARVEDNRYLMATGYKATLQALPEPLRSRLLTGDFAAARDDDPAQIIPTAWIEAAMARWAEQSRAEQSLADQPAAPMDALGVDVARGGADRTVLTARHGAWFAPAQSWPGKATPDGPSVAALVIAACGSHLGPIGRVRVQIDVIGVGAAVYDAVRLHGLDAVPLNGAQQTEARDRSGQLRFANARAEYYWRLREALDPATGERLMLPPDRELLADLAAPRWRLTLRGILVESKDELRQRLGRSPDKGDSLIYAHALPHRPGAGFLDFMRDQAAAVVTPDLASL